MPFQNPNIDIYLLVLLLCGTSGLLISYKYKLPDHLRSFAYLNALTFLVELSAYLCGFYFKNNWKIYNSFVLVETTWHLYFFYCIITAPRTRKWILFGMLFNLMVWLSTNLFVVDFFKKADPIWNSYVIIAASILTVLFAVVYLLQAIEHEHTRVLKEKPEFWIACGMLVFYTCQIPYYGALNLIIHHKLSVKAIWFGNLRSFMLILNDLMYTTFIYAFLCTTTLFKSRSKTR